MSSNTYNNHILTAKGNLLQRFVLLSLLHCREKVTKSFLELIFVPHEKKFKTNISQSKVLNSDYDCKYTQAQMLLVSLLVRNLFNTNVFTIRVTNQISSINSIIFCRYCMFRAHSFLIRFFCTLDMCRAFLT